MQTHRGQSHTGLEGVAQRLVSSKAAAGLGTDPVPKVVPGVAVNHINRWTEEHEVVANRGYSYQAVGSVRQAGEEPITV